MSTFDLLAVVAGILAACGIWTALLGKTRRQNKRLALFAREGYSRIRDPDAPKKDQARDRVQ
jgi:hypothetical protein